MKDDDLFWRYGREAAQSSHKATGREENAPQWRLPAHGRKRR